MDKASQLDSLFYPRSIAVVGATNASFFGQYPKVLIDFGFKGKLFPVNPKGGEVFGLKVVPERHGYPGAGRFGGHHGAGALVAQVLEDCLAKGVKGGAGLQLGVRGDGRRRGAALERELAANRGAGDTHHRAELLRHLLSGRRPHAAPGRRLPERRAGRSASSRRAAATRSSCGRQAQGRGLRFSKVVSYGNACDVNESDLLEYMARDAETKVITMYLEGPREGRRFFELVK